MILIAQQTLQTELTDVTVGPLNQILHYFQVDSPNTTNHVQGSLIVIIFHIWRKSDHIMYLLEILLHLEFYTLLKRSSWKLM